MEDKDIVGKTFTAFKFHKTKHLHYTSQYEQSFGKKAKVLHLHHDLPYAYCSIKINPTTTIQNYYPTERIIEQLEEVEKEQNQSIDDILIEMKQLISQI
jgi:hypothetical protein